MFRKLLFGFFMISSSLAFGQLNPGHFEIRLVDLAGNFLGLEMRALQAPTAPHGNGDCTLSGDNTLFNDLIFTLKCVDCNLAADLNEVFVDNCTATEMEEYGYGIEDAGSPVLSNGYYLHPFSLDNNPFDSPENWPVGVWIQLTEISHAADIDPASVSIVTYHEALVDPGFGLNREPNIALIEDPMPEVSYTPSVEGVLPLDLIAFKARKFGERSSLLEWSTVNEVNTSHFVVERSDDKVKWTELGKVQASGQSQSVLNYNFTDTDVYDGRKANARFYYRLKLVDSDGKTDNSRIEVVQFSSNTDVAQVFVFPNPSRDGVNVELSYNKDTAQPAEMMIYNDLGQMVFHQVVGEASILEYIDYSKTNIVSGTYTLQVMDQTNGIIATEKIVVQR